MRGGKLDFQEAGSARATLKAGVSCHFYASAYCVVCFFLLATVSHSLKIKLSLLQH